MVQTFSLEHTPSDRPVHVALYRDVHNSPFLKEQLLAGNPDFEYAFIEASLIVSTVHALAAVYRALHDSSRGRLKTRNVHSEIVFSLGPNNNIAESFRRFGISEGTSSLLVVKVSMNPSITHDSVQQHLGSVIEGTLVEFTDENLRGLTDLDTVRKYYKLNAGAKKRPARTDAEGSEKPTNGVDPTGEGREAKALEAAILGAMTLRGAA